MYYCLTKFHNKSIDLMEADKDEKKLLTKLDDICRNKLKERGITEYKLLECEPEKLIFPTSYVVSNRNLSNKTEIHHVHVKDIVKKGWIYNSKKFEIIHDIEIYDIIPIQNINIVDENLVFKKYIYDVNDFSREKKRKTYDGESLFLN
jgi:hypothetical protein